MASNNRFLILVSFILVIYSVESDGQAASPKLMYTFIPVRTDSWWRIYANTSNHDDVPYDNAVNDSLMGIRTVQNEDSGSVFSWEMDMKLKNVILSENRTMQKEAIMLASGRDAQISGK